MKKSKIYELQIESLNNDIVQTVKETYIENLLKNIDVNIRTLTIQDFINYLKEPKPLKRFLKGTDQIKAQLIMGWISYEMFMSELMLEDKIIHDLELYDLSSLKKKNKKNDN